LLKAVSYVELNPVKAGMVDFAWDYPLGSDSFIEMAESSLNRDLKKKKPGSKVLDDGN